MSSAVIVEAIRTPVGKRGGGLADVHAADLAADLLNALIDRVGIDPALINDVIFGCVGQVGEQSTNVARSSVLAAGWPQTVAGVTLDRQCGSSQQAVHFAVGGLASGEYDVVVAGGVESMTRVPMGTNFLNDPNRYPVRLVERLGGDKPNQGLSAEMIAQHWDISRSELDEFSLRSHERAAAAHDRGSFDRQLVPVVSPSNGIVAADEGVRRDTSLEKLSALKPAFVEDGRVTAGNSSQISDGAAVLLLMSEQRAAELGLAPVARVHTTVVIGDDPKMMLTAPIAATRKIVAKSGVALDDIGHIEISEAFASVPCAWLKEFGVDPAKVNPLGGRERCPHHDDPGAQHARERHPLRPPDDVRGWRTRQRDASRARAMTSVGRRDRQQPRGVRR